MRRSSSASAISSVPSLDAPHTPQGAVDAATVLPFVAAVLLAPPIILIFGAPVMLAGIPLILVYVFGVWAAIILAAALLARRLSRNEVVALDEIPPEAGGQN
jgi:hypothetical protein